MRGLGAGLAWTVAVAALFGLAPAPPGAARAPATTYTFVSIPDWLNGDLGDVRGLPGHDPGDGNSWNAQYAASIALVTSEVAAQHPDAVLVAGDLAGGHWGCDDAGIGVFGPVGSRRSRLAALSRAGDFYYGEWRSRFAEAGIPLSRIHPAVGDHDIGDNPWPPGGFKHRAVPEFRAAFARNLLRTPGGARRFPEHPGPGSQWKDTPCT